MKGLVQCSLSLRQLVSCCLLASVAFATTQPATAQSPIYSSLPAPLPATVQAALDDANRASMAEFFALEQTWRNIFRETRSRPRLKGFVDETISIFGKLQQIQDLAANPRATDARITTLFRQRILDEDTVCKLAEKSLAELCEKLDEQDQTLLIKLKIDREVTRTKLAGVVVDSRTFKRPIQAAAATSVNAVRGDLSRSVASFVASEAIGMGVKSAARDLGLMPGEEGSFENVLGGLLIDIGVSMAVDAVTDPTDGMVKDLEKQLIATERAILDGTSAEPGLLTTLRRITRERADARRRILDAEYAPKTILNGRLP